MCSNLSNLSFLAGAKQLICRTPPLAASGIGEADKRTILQSGQA